MAVAPRTETTRSLGAPDKNQRGRASEAARVCTMRHAPAPPCGALPPDPRHGTLSATIKGRAFKMGEVPARGVGPGGMRRTAGRVDPTRQDARPPSPFFCCWPRPGGHTVVAPPRHTFCWTQGYLIVIREVVSWRREGSHGRERPPRQTPTLAGCIGGRLFRLAQCLPFALSLLQATPPRPPSPTTPSTWMT